MMKMMKMKRAAWTAAAGLALVAPGAASAQEQIGCLRGRSLPACKTFWLVEMQTSVPIAQTKRTVTYTEQYEYEATAFENSVEWNLGHMVNVGDRYAVGGLLTVGSGNSDPLTGIKVRGRKWLGEDVSVELEAGLLRTNAGGTQYPGVSGWTTDVRLNIRDQGSFFVRYDGVSIAENLQLGDYGSVDPGGVHHGLSVGASAGSIPALIGTGALGVAYLVLFAIYWRDD